MIQEENMQALNDMGLSILQAKIYLNLVQLGEVDVGTISKASNTVRQDIYRVMPTLEKLGLAERILSKPTVFKATPLKEGISILLLERKKKNEEILKKAHSLISNFSSFSNALTENESEFRITSERSLLFKMHTQLIEKAQNTIDIIVPFEVFEEQNLSVLKKAWKKGVKIRLISQRTPDDSILKKPKGFTGISFLELRYAFCPASVDTRPFGMHIFDKKEMTVCISSNDCVPSLWSNSPSLLRMATNYFEDLWNEASNNSLLASETPLRNLGFLEKEDKLRKL
jgi:sugar-specific transcriptional regulator TrmB